MVSVPDLDALLEDLGRVRQDLRLQELFGQPVPDVRPPQERLEDVERALEG